LGSFFLLTCNKRKAAEKTFVQKRHAQNVDEINTSQLAMDPNTKWKPYFESKAGLISRLNWENEKLNEFKIPKRGTPLRDLRLKIFI